METNPNQAEAEKIMGFYGGGKSHIENAETKDLVRPLGAVLFAKKWEMY